MRLIHIQALAKQDLKNIWLYSLKIGVRRRQIVLFDELNAAFQLIVENPELGFACDYICGGYRQLHINHHLVFYRVTASKIHIVRILHESMNYGAHL